MGSAQSSFPTPLLFLLSPQTLIWTAFQLSNPSFQMTLRRDLAEVSSPRSPILS